MNIIFILFFLLIFFDSPSYKVLAEQGKPQQYYRGIFFAVGTGFLLDSFSPFNFGFNMVALLLVYVTIKTVLYFLRQRQDKYILYYFIPLFAVSFIFYTALINLFSYFPRLEFGINKNTFIELAYNLALALVIFFIYQYVSYHKKSRRLTFNQ